MRHLFRFSVVSACLLAATNIYASAFQIWEQSACGTGDYHSGAAAEGDGACNEFYNAAQITQIKHQQISAGGVIIPATVKFDGTVDSIPGASGKSDHVNIAPNFHYVAPLSKRVFFAFGLTAPFGLETDFPASNATVADAATKTQLLTINANPSIAFKATNWLSLAGGFDVLYGMATYNNVPDPGLTFKNKLSGWGVGYNAGLFIHFNIAHFAYPTQIGASYRSKINVKASGPSSYAGIKTTAKTDFHLPATTMFSVYQQVNKHVALMVSAFYTQWNVFSELLLKNTAVFGNIPVFENYKNTWNFGIGAHFIVSKKLTLKIGGGYDETPTRTGYRDIRLPDTNRYALALGLHWQVRPTLGADLGYTHLFTPKATVDNSQSSGSVSPSIPTQIGKATMDANVFGAQITWTIQ